MTKHTKGPWETDCSDHEQPYLDIKIRAAKKFARTICTVYIDDAPVRDYNDEQYANAARIVACVNALEGYNPDAVRDVVEALRDNYEGMCEGFCADFASLDFTSKECETNCGGCKSRAALARLGGAS